MSRKTRFVFLQIKIKSLAAESAIIHREERKWPRPRDTETCFVRGDLQRHRKRDLRPELRAAQLAYGFLRGKSYKSMEATCHEVPNWNRVAKLAARFAGGDYQEKVGGNIESEYYWNIRAWSKGEECNNVIERPTDADRPGTSNPSEAGSTPAGRANVPEKGLVQRVIGVFW